jgi:hypothetical protein
MTTGGGGGGSSSANNGGGGGAYESCSPTSPSPTSPTAPTSYASVKESSVVGRGGGGGVGGQGRSSSLLLDPYFQSAAAAVEFNQDLLQQAVQAAQSNSQASAIAAAHQWVLQQSQQHG